MRFKIFIFTGSKPQIVRWKHFSLFNAENLKSHLEKSLYHSGVMTC